MLFSKIFLLRRCKIETTVLNKICCVLAYLNNVQGELFYYLPVWRWQRLLQMLKFCVKVFRTSLFPNPMLHLVHVWCDDRYWSKILRSTIPTPLHDFNAKVTGLHKVLGQSGSKLVSTATRNSWLIMGKCVGQDSTFIFDWTFFKIAGNQDRHKILDELDINL